MGKDKDMEKRTMLLSKLLEELHYECMQGSVETAVSAVVYDSRKVQEGCLFICIKGANFDGHEFAKDVVVKGAKVLVVSEPVAELEDKDVTIIKVEDTRYAMAFISAAWFGHPEKKLKTIGIT